MIKDYFYDRIIDLEFTYTDEQALKQYAQAKFAESLDRVDSYMNDYHARALAGNITETEAKSFQKVLKLTCPRAGRKPRVEFEYSRVEGNVVYSIILKVYNLYLNFNAAWVDSVKVTAGYVGLQQSHLDSFDCQVFAAYTPQPGPDGYTIFQCIIAKAKGFTNTAFNFWLYNQQADKWTVEDVLADTCFNLDFQCVLYMEDWIKQAPFSMNSIAPQVFDNAYAVIGYLQKQVNQTALSSSLASRKFQIATIIFNDTVYWIGIGIGNTVDINLKLNKEEVARLPTLSDTSSIEWTAGTLTVTAPYNPHIKPATLFKIKPSVYMAKDTPNSVQRTGVNKDDWDMYYVITQSVKFSTQGDNSMTIMAIPFRYSPINNQEMSQQQSKIEDGVDKEELQQTYTMLQQKIIQIGFGDVDDIVAEAAKNAEDISKLTYNPASSIKYVIQPNDTLSTVAKAQAESMGLKRLESNKHSGENGVPAYQALYPLIIVATHTKYQNTQGSEKNKWYIDMADPDSISSGKYLSIPNIQWKDLQGNSGVINIYKKCAEYYAKTKSKPSWAQYCELCAQILEKEVIK